MNSGFLLLLLFFLGFVLLFYFGSRRGRYPDLFALKKDAKVTSISTKSSRSRKSPGLITNVYYDDGFRYWSTDSKTRVVGFNLVEYTVDEATRTSILRSAEKSHMDALEKQARWLAYRQCFKDRRRMIILALIGVCVLTLLLIVIINISHHTTAKENMKQGNYALAIASAEKDKLFSKTLRTDAIRSLGQEYFEKGDFENAITQFALLGEDGLADWNTAVLAFGQSYYDAGDYDRALVQFARLGADGKTAWCNTKYQMALQSVKNKQYQAAIDSFSKIVEDGSVAEYVDNATYQIAQCQLLLGDYEKARITVRSISNPDLIDGDLPLLLQKTFYQEGLAAIRSCDLPAAVECFTASGDYPDAGTILSILQLVRDGNYFDAASLAAQTANDGESISRKDWEIFFTTYLKHAPAITGDWLQTLNAKLLFHAATQQLSSVTADPDLTKIRRVINDWGSILEPDMEANWAVSNLSDLYAQCGKSAAGKILVIWQSKKFKTLEPACYVAFDMMKQLPAELSPKNLAEVSYVIRFTYTCIHDCWYYGMFDSTPSREGVRESAAFAMTQYPGGKAKLTVSSVSGAKPPSEFYVSIEDCSKYKSGGAPSSQQLADIMMKAMGIVLGSK